MSDAYIGEIRMFAGDYAPAYWGFCAGSLIAVSENQALFSLIGSSYGGNGRTVYGLPDMRGRIPVHNGRGSGLSFYPTGQKVGFEGVTLTLGQMPTHKHYLQGSDIDANTSQPQRAMLARQSDGTFYTDDLTSTSLEKMADNQMLDTGGGQAHSNVMPFHTLSFIICLTGLYPSRN